MTLIGIPRETTAGERRVALVPKVVERLCGAGLAVVVEAGPGAAPDRATRTTKRRAPPSVILGLPTSWSRSNPPTYDEIAC